MIYHYICPQPSSISKKPGKKLCSGYLREGCSGRLESTTFSGELSSTTPRPRCGVDSDGGWRHFKGGTRGGNDSGHRLTVSS